MVQDSWFSATQMRVRILPAARAHPRSTSHTSYFAPKKRLVRQLVTPSHLRCDNRNGRWVRSPYQPYYIVYQSRAHPTRYFSSRSLTPVSATCTTCIVLRSNSRSTVRISITLSSPKPGRLPRVGTIAVLHLLIFLVLLCVAKRDGRREEGAAQQSNHRHESRDH